MLNNLARAVLGAAAVLALGAGVVTPAMASPAAVSVVPLTWHDNHCYQAIDEEDLQMLYYSASAGWFQTSATKWTQVCPQTGNAWQEFGLPSSLGAGQCLSYNATYNLVTKHACNGDNYELWNTVWTDEYGYQIFNEYVNENDTCPAGTGYYPILSALGSADAEMLCPLTRGGTYPSPSQLWDAVIAP